MDLRHLRYFVAAVETGAIARAAVRCHIAQPSISQAIQRLENELGTTLLHRQREGVHPTPAGEQLYRDATRLLQDAARIKHRFQSPSVDTSVTVRVPRTISGQRLSALLRILQSRLPMIQWLVVTESDSAVLSLQSDSGEVTATAIFPLWTETYHLLLPRDQHWPSLPAEQLALLRDLPLIERRYCEQRPMFEHWLSGSGISCRVAASVSSEDQAQALVAEGIGWTLAPVVPGESLRGIRTIDLAALAGTAHLPRRRLGLAADPAWMKTDLGRQLQDSWDQESDAVAD